MLIVSKKYKNKSFDSIYYVISADAGGYNLWNLTYGTRDWLTRSPQNSNWDYLVSKAWIPVLDYCEKIEELI